MSSSVVMNVYSLHIAAREVLAPVFLANDADVDWHGCQDVEQLVLGVVDDHLIDISHGVKL